MPSERAARDGFLVAAERIRTLMSITDEIDELIPPLTKKGPVR
jgi:hypothetical protein